MDLFDLVATLTLDTSEYEQKLDDSEAKGKGFGKGLATAGKLAVAATGAAATAVGVLTKKSVDAYANYEQLAGGIEKLFGKEAAANMMQYAEDGYKTAGMSANQYMNTAIGFSGALLKSLEGDTKKGAEMTNMAIQDMSDMANTYGKTTEEISQTYTSLARGNFQTLDNLFGGMFAGTKTGLQEMLDYAEDYRASMGETVSYSADSYADIVSAIHDVSEATGVYGTTQAEAANTIQGSLNMTKAAWDNLVTSLANPDADVGTAIDNLVVAIVGDKQGEGLLNQLIPAVQRAVEGIGTFIQAAVPKLAQQLPALIQTFLPVAIDAIVTLVASIAEALPDIIVTLVDMMPQIVDKVINGLVDAIMKAVPVLIKAAPQIVKALAKGIISAIGTLLAAGGKLISSLGNTIKTKLSDVATKAVALAKKIPQKIKSGLGSLADAGRNLIEGLWDGIKAKFDSVISKVKALAAKLPSAVKKVLGIASPSKVFMELGKWIPEGLALGIERNSDVVSTAVNGMVDSSIDMSASGIGGGSGVQITNYFTVNGADDPEYFADVVSDRLTRQLKLGMRTI